MLAPARSAAMPRRSKRIYPLRSKHTVSRWSGPLAAWLCTLRQFCKAHSFLRRLPVDPSSRLSRSIICAVTSNYSSTALRRKTDVGYSNNQRATTMNQDGVMVLVGTTKGAFTISSRSDRNGWTVKGPFCDGWPINHVIGDPATRVLWAGGGGDWHGAGVWRSEDLGATWDVAKLTKGQIDDWAAKDPKLAAMVN